jgi:hypothetical protein
MSVRRSAGRRRVGAARSVGTAILIAAMVPLLGWPDEAQPADAPSPKVLAAVAPVLDAITRAKWEDAALAPARSVSERLRRLGKLDQSGRRQIFKVNWASFTASEGIGARRVIAAQMEPLDQADLAAVLSLLPPEGWFSYSRYGREAADAAFDIVQHGDTATQQQLLPYIEAFAKAGEADPENFAKMYDRVLIAKRKPQRYGTQFHCVDGYTQPFPIEDQANVEARRKSIGMRDSFTEMAAAVASQACR